MAKPAGVLVITVIVLFCLVSAAQQPCPAPPPIHHSAGNIFTSQQELDLGGIVADRSERELQVINDEALNAKLQTITERLAKQLPLDMPVQARLSDIAVVNAFTMPGGRIYVTRKLVAFTRTEDELAGILAHELGHAVSHDAAVTMSMLLQRVLGVTTAGDKADILEKYNRLLDNIARRTIHLPDELERKQLNADQIAVYAMARAGYDPQAYAEAWDRVAETHGNTGNWFTNFFGATKPEAKRLREALKAAASLPKECLGSVSGQGDFAQWRMSVIEYSHATKEEIPGLIAHKQITPPLRADIGNVQFSPDGKYFLAQDETTIFVMTRDPLALRFKIDAPDAFSASFTPDSSSIVFYDTKFRVERWNVEQRKRTAVNELALTHKCIESALSPDGRYLVCLDEAFGLRVIDVASGNASFEKKEFYQPTFFDYLLLYSAMFVDSPDVNLLGMAFSPDAHYLVVGRNGTSIAIDLSSMKPVSMDGKVKEALRHRFAFVGPDRLAGDTGGKSAIMTFPTGEAIAKGLILGSSAIEGVTKGDYIIVRPIKDFAAGVFDVKNNKIVIGLANRGVDIWNNTIAFEQRNGEIHLRTVGQTSETGPNAILQLPDSALGRLRAVDLSPDMKTLVISQRSRGGIWNLETGKRLAYVRGFNGAWITPNGHVFADFPKFKELDRALVDIDPATNKTQTLLEFDKKDIKTRVWQDGAYLLTLKAVKDNRFRENCDLEFRDAATQSLLWTQHFPREVPGINMNSEAGTVVFEWNAFSYGIRDEINSDPVLKERYHALKDKQLSAFLQVFDVKTGQKRGGIILDTGKGSFRPRELSALNEWLVVRDDQNRIHLFSLATGEQKAVYFGHRAVLSPNGDLLAIENEEGQVSTYSLSSLKKVQDYIFPAETAWMRFSNDGKRLFVLTRAQHAYWIATESKEDNVTALQ